MHVNPAQGRRLAVAQPGDVGNAPVVLDLHEVEYCRCLCAEIDELDGRTSPTGRCVGHGDIEVGNVPFLGVDKRIEVEQPNFARLAAFFWSLTISAASVGSK